MERTHIAGVEQMSRLELLIPGLTPPSVNHAWKHRRIGNHIATYKTATAKSFAAAVVLIAAGRTIAPECEKARAKVKYRVCVTAFLGKGVRLDADNQLKVSLDALTACGVIHSDARVAEATGKVVWNERDNPRTLIEVEVME